jgi:hypothetical protein
MQNAPAMAHETSMDGGKRPSDRNAPSPLAAIAPTIALRGDRRTNGEARVRTPSKARVTSDTSKVKKNAAAANKPGRPICRPDPAHIKLTVKATNIGAASRKTNFLFIEVVPLLPPDRRPRLRRRITMHV